MSSQERAKLIRTLLDSFSDGPDPSLAPGDGFDALSSQEQARIVKNSLAMFLKPNSFQPGDLVVWKGRMRNRTRPRYNQPAIVIEVLDAPLYDEDESSGSQYYREPLDLRLGFIDRDGDFVTLLVDQRRFTHYIDADLA